MRMEMHQGMRLEQRQILSQQLIQNMQLLQVPILQLSELIMQEIEQNPALELKAEEPEEAPEPAEPAETDTDDILTEIESQRDFQRASSPGPSAQSLDDERDEMIQNLAVESVSLQQHLLAQLKDAGVSDELRLIVENLINSLDERGYLRIGAQDAATILSTAYTGVDYEDLLQLVKGDPDRYSVEAIVKILEPRHPGLPQEPLIERIKADMKSHTCEALAVMFARSMPGRTVEELIPTVEQGVRVLQGFEPKGVGAIDTRECFLLQLNPHHADAPRQRWLIERHLDDIIHNRIPKIAQAILENPQAQAVFGWNAAVEPAQAVEEIKYTVEDLTALNPSPGRTFSGERAAVVVPDIIVKQIDGEMEIILEESYLPPVTVSASVVEMARKGEALSKEERDFLRKKVEAARRIVQAIEQRRTTLTRITRRILEKQADFFEKGVEALKPLTMTELADELGVHVSTVARAVKDKYVQTPRGIYSLRFFFAAAAPAAAPMPAPFGAPALPNGTPSSEEHTRDFVIARIREIVSHENRARPLSDKKIMEMLETQHGLKLKRRTVAKYREESGILSSKLRKTF
jgi:RNA polymerase sigma-54 factor